ncbi:TadE/TadG family type IV pilus assembly protein [Sphingomonas alba]|uniref:Pilus assembly protein n=1 Tax=Sphingomonas alba TaxID=2908208 RepID=A0ABT0RPI4_9SPHN|nr:TadE/TadG family type IV pilus assembly protein [Sphingomonas alba]MCL6684505.1 pilus assembly protein [Sphingomonas alba]
MLKLARLFHNRNAAAAAEMALVTPLLLGLMFGSAELGNFFADQHALEKQVRDGARYASRLEFNTTYACPDSVFQDADWRTKTINVTKNGAVSGAGNPRWTTYWDRSCTGGSQTVTASIRCVNKSAVATTTNGPTGLYSSLAGTTIPVVKVSGAVEYRSVLGRLGLDLTNVCLRADSEAAVQGL